MNWSKKHKMNWSAVTWYVSISAFAFLVGISVEVRSSAVG